MSLNHRQLNQFRTDGFLLLEQQFTPVEIDVMRAELRGIFAEESPARVMEKDTRIVRSVYGSHARNEVFRRLSLHPRLAGPTMQILDSPVYIHQFKINAKAAFGGDAWEWHQDFIFWFKEDGMPRADAVNAAVYLDEVTEFNGPILLIPGSQKAGMIDTEAIERTARAGDIEKHYGDKPAWISNLTASLKYSLGRDLIAGLVDRYGIAAPKGPRGSVLLFDCNIVHSSATNMSPHDRAVALITYNSTANIPKPCKEPRPEFLASRDYDPIVPLSDDALLTCCEVARRA